MHRATVHESVGPFLVILRLAVTHRAGAAVLDIGTFGHDDLGVFGNSVQYHRKFLLLECKGALPVCPVASVCRMLKSGRMQARAGETFLALVAWPSINRNNKHKFAESA